MINKVLVINKTNIVVQYYLYTEAQKLDHLLKKQRQQCILSLIQLFFKIDASIW